MTAVPASREMRKASLLPGSADNWRYLQNQRGIAVIRRKTRHQTALSGLLLLFSESGFLGDSSEEGSGVPLGVAFKDQGLAGWN